MNGAFGGDRLTTLDVFPVASATDQSQAHPGTPHLLTADKFLTKTFKRLIGPCQAQMRPCVSCNVERESNSSVRNWFRGQLLVMASPGLRWIVTPTHAYARRNHYPTSRLIQGKQI